MKHTCSFFILGAGLFLAGCSAESDETVMHKRLLAATPIGMEATNVLRFVVDDLKPKQGAIAYYKYVDVLQTVKHRKLDVTPENLTPAIPMPPNWASNKNWPPRQIYVVLKTYFVKGRLGATWTFDKNDKLLEIDVGTERGL